MKHLFTSALSTALVLSAGIASATVPTFVPLQGRLTDMDGNVVEGPHDVSFTLYADATGGTPVYTETHAQLPVEGGDFFAYLGGGTSDTALTADLVASESGLFVEVTLDGVESIEPRFEVGSVPYALVAGQCASAGQADSATHADNADLATEATHAGSADLATSATHADSATSADSALTCNDATKLGGKDPSEYSYSAGSGISITSSNQVSIASHGVTGSMLASNLVYSGNMTVAGTQEVSSGSGGGSFRVQTSGDSLLMDGENVGTTASVLHINQNGGDSKSTAIHGPLLATSTAYVQGWLQVGYVQKTCQSATSCSCPAGTRIVSGGAHATSGNTLRSSYPSSETQWVALDTSQFGYPTAIHIVCARLSPDFFQAN